MREQQLISSLRAPWSADRRADASDLTTEAPQCDDGCRDRRERHLGAREPPAAWLVLWNGDLNELLATAWHFDQRVRCTAGHIVGVLTRLANDRGGPDPLADGKTRSLRSRISGGTKWLGLRSKSKSPKFGADRKQFSPDDP